MNMSNELNDRLKGVRRTHAWWDANVDRLKRMTAGMGGPVTCGGLGCSACCSEPVLCTRQEAELVLEGVAGEEVEGLLIDLRAWAEKAWGTGQLDKAEPSAFTYRAARLRCPLLVGEGVCSVYTDRPLACRAHLAIGPVEACVDDEARKTQKYCTAPELLMGAVVQEAEEDAKSLTLVYDLLPVWLCELLLPEEEYSWDKDTGPATRHVVEIKFS